MTRDAGIPLRELAGKQSLLTGEAADTVLERIGPDQIDPGSTIVVDFAGVLGITPTFLRQLLGGLRQRCQGGPVPFSVRMLNVPTPASEKYSAVGRIYGMVLSQPSAGEWLLVEQGR